MLLLWASCAARRKPRHIKKRDDSKLKNYLRIPACWTCRPQAWSIGHSSCQLQVRSPDFCTPLWNWYDAICPLCCDDVSTIDRMPPHMSVFGWRREYYYPNTIYGCVCRWLGAFIREVIRGSAKALEVAAFIQIRHASCGPGGWP